MPGYGKKRGKKMPKGEYRKPTPRKKRLSKDAGAEAIQKAKAKAGGSGKMTRKMTGSGY